MSGERRGSARAGRADAGRRRGWLVALAIAAAAPMPAAGGRAAWAAPDAGARVRERLARGQAEFQDLEYRRAIRTLTSVVRDPAATRAQRLRAYALIGQSHLILGDKARAREAFEELLAIDPGYQLRDDTGSPKIRDFFDRVKRDFVPDAAASAAELEHSAPRGATGGGAVELEVVVRAGAAEVAAVTALMRRRGVLAYTRSVPLRAIGEGRWRARFTAAPSRSAYVLEYYLEARDVVGRGLGRVAGPETPLALPVTAGGAMGTAWYRRWYVLAGGGALLVGIGGALLVTSGDEAPDGSLPPGTVTITP
jgi:tetratricopeptide (TPR) repeat protein